jgi:hypothetical protein
MHLSVLSNAWVYSVRSWSGKLELSMYRSKTGHGISEGFVG